MAWAQPFQQPASTTVQPQRQMQPSAGEQAGNGADIQAEWQKFSAGKPPGTQTLQQFVDLMKAKGVNISIPTRGGGELSSDKLVLPNQQVIDVWGDVGGANTPMWSADGYWVDGKPSSTPGQWSDPNIGEGGPAGFSLQGQNGLASFGAPGLLAPWTQEFQKPDPANMAASPSFQWNMSRGLDALEKFKGAGGTLNTGGAKKDAMEFASGLASQEYDKDWNRNMQLYGMNRDTFWGNQNNAFGKLDATSRLGLGAAGNFANNVSSLYQNQGNANATNQAKQGTNWNNLFGSGMDTILDRIFK